MSPSPRTAERRHSTSSISSCFEMEKSSISGKGRTPPRFAQCSKIEATQLPASTSCEIDFRDGKPRQRAKPAFTAQLGSGLVLNY